MVDDDFAFTARLAAEIDSNELINAWVFMSY